MEVQEIKNKTMKKYKIELTEYQLKALSSVLNKYDETLEDAAKKEWGHIHRTGVLGFIDGAKWQQKQMYSTQQVLELMKQAFEAGFKKADTVEAGLEPKETEQEINWILLKQNNK